MELIVQCHLSLCVFTGLISDVKNKAPIVAVPKLYKHRTLADRAPLLVFSLLLFCLLGVRCFSGGWGLARSRFHGDLGSFCCCRSQQSIHFRPSLHGRWKLMFSLYGWRERGGIRDRMHIKALWIKKSGQNWSWAKSMIKSATCVKLWIWAALYARFKCSKYQKPREDWSRALLRHVLTFGITGRATFWSISHKDFFPPELSAILLWVSLDFQCPWPLSSQEIKKKIFQKSYVYEIWLTIHFSLDSGCWLFQPSGSWASNKASTVGSLAFSEVRFGKFSLVVLKPFLFI